MTPHIAVEEICAILIKITISITVKTVSGKLLMLSKSAFFVVFVKELSKIAKTGNTYIKMEIMQKRKSKIGNCRNNNDLSS